MNTQLHYMIARQRGAELRRMSERARPLNEVRAGQPNPSQPASGDGAAAARGRHCWMAVASVLVGAGWGSNQFTPMLLVYRHALGLSAGSLEAMFGVYALGLIPGFSLARYRTPRGAAGRFWPLRRRRCWGACC